MPAVVKDLVIEQGASFSLPFQWCDPERDAEGNLVLDEEGNLKPGPGKDLSGVSARMQIRKSQASPILVEATTENGKIVLGVDVTAAEPNYEAPDPTNGWILVDLTDEDTDKLTSKEAVYDLEVEINGRVFRLLKGKAAIDFNVTQQEGAENVVRALRR